VRGADAQFLFNLPDGADVVILTGVNMTGRRGVPKAAIEIFFSSSVFAGTTALAR